MSKKRNTGITLWIVIFSYLSIFGVTAFGDLQPGTCTIKFSGSSTLHDFHGSVSSAPFELDFQKMGQTNYVLSGTITAAVAKMDTENKKRDKKMRRMFEEAAYPLITVEIKNLIVPATKLAEPRFERNVILSIRNKKVTKSVHISNYRITKQSISFNVEFPVSLSEFGLKSPSVMKLIKVGDTVNVTATLHFDLTQPKSNKQL
jgi:polyisoprenoid-binding protein YceI